MLTLRKNKRSLLKQLLALGIRITPFDFPCQSQRKGNLRKGDMEKSGTVATVGAFSPLIGDRILVHGWDSCVDILTAVNGR